MQSVYSIDDISESSLIAQFDLLLSCLPNGGKLYKYRSLCGKSFSYAYDGLANGYMWIAPVKTLNDDFDSVMISDAKSEGKRFIDYIMQDYDKTLYTLVMRYLLNTYKVIYSETPKEISPEFLAEAFFFSPDDSSLKEQLERFILEKVLCKDKCWENEKEWRIVLGNTDCKMPVDIVSAIIIDERSLQKTNAQKLIRLCKKRGWQVKVRKNHLFNTSHSYDAHV